MQQPIDYNPATHKLNEVLYEVALQPVYSTFRFPDPLFNQPISTKNHLAIVNQNNGNIISVVSHNYKLIPNSDALDMGKHLFNLLYPGLAKDDLIPYKVIAPDSLASVHIDLIHKKVNFDVWEQETWLPFLRVSNSYNRSHALTFEIGFVRKLCSNGVLFRKKTMQIKYPHANSNKFDLEADANNIRNNQNIFRNQCKKLADIKIPVEFMFPLVCRVLNINLAKPDKKQGLKKLNHIENIFRSVADLTSLYCKNGDPSGYDALSVISDLVSHQDRYKSLSGYHLNTRSYFTRPADFIDLIVEQPLNKEFKPGDLLKTTIKQIRDFGSFFGRSYV